MDQTKPSLKNQTRNGIIWSSIDKFSGQAFQFVIGILLARLLMPEDYGIIGMLAIFLAISDSIIDSGFGNALIQKQNRTQSDYSTVFYFNILVSLILYIILFICAPYIATFYNMPILTSVTRVLSINFIINAFMIVQVTKLTIELDFKIQAKVRLFSGLIAGLFALYMAYSGFGVWALVSQMVISNLLLCILLWLFAKWRPSLEFSVESFKQLFSYGSKLLITGLYGPIFTNINTLIIGKFYSTYNLGLFTRAHNFAQFPAVNTNLIISRVSFPVLSKMQNDDERLRLNYRKLISLTYFLFLPIMFGLIIIAKPLIILLFTEKWIGIVPLFQILCISLAFLPINGYNINLLLVKGRTSLHLRLDFIKKVVSLVILIICAFISIKAICIGSVITSIFSWVLTAHYSGKLINLTLIQQFEDIVRPLIITVAMCCLIYIPFIVINNSVSQLILALIIGIPSYYLMSLKFNAKSIGEIKKIIIK